MINIFAIIAQLLAFLSLDQLLTLLQTILSVVTALAAQGLPADQILAKLIQAIKSIS